MWTELKAQGALDEVGAIDTHVAAELSICMDVVHGTKPRPYGALVTLAPPPATVGRLLTSNLDDEELRRVAEGRSLLVCRSRATPMQLLQLRRPLHTDADWEALVGIAAGVLVRIDVRGRIWVVGSRATSCVDGRETWTRPHMGRVIDALTSAAPAADPRTLEALARLAYSHVSPASVGATLVYQLTRSEGDGGCFSGVTLDALRLNINQATQLSGILHQIEHRDGAVIFDRNGGLRRAGVILVPSAGALAAVGAIRGGTRHHSAAWHSYDRPDVICFVVSKAGRVTVFSRGENVSPTMCRRTSSSTGVEEDGMRSRSRAAIG